LTQTGTGTIRGKKQPPEKLKRIRSKRVLRGGEKVKKAGWTREGVNGAQRKEGAGVSEIVTKGPWGRLGEAGGN